MAKGIIGRKLGMTQVFDPETGGVTSVTVIEAGPCPVVQVRTNEVDGYEAVQLAYDPVPERKLTKPQLGHLRRFGVAPHRKLVEFRGPIDGGVEGESVTVEVFQPGASGTTSRAVRGRTARTTSVPPARSAPRRRRHASSRACGWRGRWARSESRRSACGCTTSIRSATCCS
jgi:ribosomal protein L3